VTRKSGQTVQAQEVSISVTGGAAEKTLLSTDEDGLTKTTIHWTDQIGSATILIKGMQPITINRKSGDQKDKIQ
jgi:hypothetical protein